MIYQIKIINFAKHNPRKDVKRPSWFAFDNRMIEDADFFDFNHGEFKTWVYILSRASQKQSEEAMVNSEHAWKVCNISEIDLASGIKKLIDLGIVEHVTSTLRARDVDVQSGGQVTNATDRQTLQTDKTDTPERTSADVQVNLNNLKKSKREVEGEMISAIQEIYEASYPLKKGKSKGTARLAKEILTAGDLARFSQAVANYAIDCAKNKTDPKFTKHFSTFAGEWKDWVDFVPPESPAAAADWTAEARIFQNVVREFGPDYGTQAMQKLGPERAEFLKHIGGLRVIREAPAGDFGVQKIAKMISEYVKHHPYGKAG